jgi:hypothetical protein
LSLGTTAATAQGSLVLAFGWWFRWFGELEIGSGITCFRSDVKQTPISTWSHHRKCQHNPTILCRPPLMLWRKQTHSIGPLEATIETIVCYGKPSEHNCLTNNMKSWQFTKSNTGFESNANSGGRISKRRSSCKKRCLTRRKRTEEPQTHAVTSMSNDNSQDFLPGTRTYCLEGSNWINCKTKTWTPWRRRIPTILHACQQSRAVVLKIYTCLAARHHAGSWEEREMYFNTLYNSFYMGYKK